MKYLIISTILLLSGCVLEAKPLYKHGQKVTNGICIGVITDIYYATPYRYTVSAVDCPSVNLTASFMIFREGEIEGVVK